MSFFKPLLREHFVELAQNAGPSPTAISGPIPSIQVHLNENTLTNPWESAKYPEPQNTQILARLAEKYNVPKEHIFLTPGADAGIHGLSELMLNAGDAVLIHSPTFFSYTNYARKFQAAAIDVPLVETNDNFELDTKAILQKISEASGKLKLVYICTPNNPTGSSFDENHIHDILKAAEKKGIGVVIDEAYIELSGKPSILARQEEHPNLIVLRTLSKAYSLAGERVGALICSDPELIKTAKTVLQPMFAGSKSTIAKALEQLDPANTNKIEASWQTIRDQRETLRDAINAAKGMRAFQSDTNFILIGVGNAKGVFNAFRKHNILVNNPALFNFADKVRISLGTAEENKQIAQALQAMDLSR